jgi:hypothetical protein
MNWLRLEKALGAWSAWYRPRLGRAVAKEPGAEFHPEGLCLFSPRCLITAPVLGRAASKGTEHSIGRHEGGGL